jgi:hypothetical protein
MPTNCVRGNRIAKRKRLASHLAISQAAAGFTGAASNSLPKWSDHARRSTGLVKRRHRRHQGRIIAVANASVMRTSPAVATKGETIPSTESEVGMRPTWIAKNTPTRVKIHKRSVALRMIRRHRFQHAAARRLRSKQDQVLSPDGRLDARGTLLQGFGIQPPRRPSQRENGKRSN